MNWKNLFRRTIGNSQMYFHIDNLEVGNLNLDGYPLVFCVDDLLNDVLTSEQTSAFNNALAVKFSNKVYPRINVFNGDFPLGVDTYTGEVFGYYQETDEGAFIFYVNKSTKKLEILEV